MVGRKREMAALQRAMMSGESEFVAIYGRRRIGKTYLVREFFKGGFGNYGDRPCKVRVFRGIGFWGTHPAR